VVEELVAHVRMAFGWDEDVVVSAGPRGALGQIWRLEAGPARYALKEIFAEPPSEAFIEAELAFARRSAPPLVRPGSQTSPTGRARPVRTRRGPRGSLTGWPPCPSWARR
jgi:hypothetical protein